MIIHLKRIGTHTLPVPGYATAGAAGIDLRAVTDAEIHWEETALIGTGWAIEIPPGYVGLIRDRSGQARRGLTTRAGVIDSDYRGEIGVLLTNESSEPTLAVGQGERIAQLILVPMGHQHDLLEVDGLTDTARGSGGFGSTGHQ